MFNKVLIANRGAIAVRIIRTLKRLNIASVAVYAEVDAESLHVVLADEAVPLGNGGAATTYLDAQKIIEIAKATGAEAIHPGYGFLSENAEFVERCNDEGLKFIGPTAHQIREFGLKHRARELAHAAGVPMLKGSDLLTDVSAAITTADQVGYPVMLKTTAGGGGIGMQRCNSADELKQAFESVKRLGANNFADDGVFIEKFIANARHIEVQILGDGAGRAVALGERDCSSQRRNQKVIEECPAPHLSDEIRKQLHTTAQRLLESVDYRNAGTVEFIFDADQDRFYFLEVNTRLQVEHGVTEEVFGLDLVEWMLKIAANETESMVDVLGQLIPRGHAIQVRVYAEDPWRQFQPCPGLLTQVSWPDSKSCRIDHWIKSGIEVPTFFDPMLGKLICAGADRTAALSALEQALSETKIYGTETNLDYLLVLVKDERVQSGKITTRYLDEFHYLPNKIEVLAGGTQTTLQDFPGRAGYWHVGVPRSGPFDSYSFRLVNRLLNNPEDACALEYAVHGPTLRFAAAAQIVLGGADVQATLDGIPIQCWSIVNVQSGQVLTVGPLSGSGARGYMAVAGGFDVPNYLGSKSTFTLGKFGGLNGRALAAGDVLPCLKSKGPVQANVVDSKILPKLDQNYELRVIYGPHGAPDFLTPQDIDDFFDSTWTVHFNSSRTGVRLVGPKPTWARLDGGEAGLHPSNIHDNAYAFGTVDFTGDMPVILGPDGPSLGGFVCPATVITADLWKIGQLKAGDRVRFVPVSTASALQLEQQQLNTLTTLEPCELPHSVESYRGSPILRRLKANEFGEEIVFRSAGDHFLLVEYGPMELDIKLRFRAHALMQWLEHQQLNGLYELTPGIRSLQVHYNPFEISQTDLINRLVEGERVLSEQIMDLEVPSRIVHIPLSWDDEVCRIATEKYNSTVRANAPWSPSNLEFIRRINGLPDIEAVKDIVFSASYLVMGLGDVYLGAPVATPIDPRQRLVTTKYNPARTWTAENSVGIGGSYLCVYGMEGPGGYQFVGRTLQMWNRYVETPEFEKPWLLRFFDQIRFYPVSQEKLLAIRKDFPNGRYPLRIEPTTFSLSDYEDFINQHSQSIDSFKQHRQIAFEDELARWHSDGQFKFDSVEATPEISQQDWPDHATVIDSPLAGGVWEICVDLDQWVEAGDVLLVLESMKMEIPIQAAQAGRVTRILVEPGASIAVGASLLVIE